MTHTIVSFTTSQKRSLFYHYVHHTTGVGFPRRWDVCNIFNEFPVKVLTLLLRYDQNTWFVMPNNLELVQPGFKFLSGMAFFRKMWNRCQHGMLLLMSVGLRPVTAFDIRRLESGEYKVVFL